MKRQYKRWLGICAMLLVSGGIALNLLAYRHAYAMTHFSKGDAKTAQPETLTLGQKVKVLLCGVNLPRPQTTNARSSLGLSAKAIAMPGPNGIKLGAWYCPGERSSPLVILFHGYGGEKAGTLREAEAFLGIGCSVLLVDFRGSGDSSESYTTIGFHEAEDVAAAVRYAREYLPHSKVVLYGQSMGAAAILRAVHVCGLRADAIIVEAVFDRMLSTVRHRFEAMGLPSFPGAEVLVCWGGWQFGFNAFAHNPVQYAASVDCPILFLHGNGDPRAHVEEARRVFAAVPGPKRFREFSGLRHEPSVVRYPKEWRDTVGQFLRESIDKR